jgi:hypothetical protein
MEQRTEHSAHAQRIGETQRDQKESQNYFVISELSYYRSTTLTAPLLHCFSLETPLYTMFCYVTLRYSSKLIDTKSFIYIYI